MNEILIEITGWIGSILIVGAFGLNSLGKIQSKSLAYQLANLVGGICFIINTLHHRAYPSAFVNVVWVFIAIFSILKNKTK
jgi:hypothetical protein